MDRVAFLGVAGPRDAIAGLGGSAPGSDLIQVRQPCDSARDGKIKVQLVKTPAHAIAVMRPNSGIQLLPR